MKTILDSRPCTRADVSDVNQVKLFSRQVTAREARTGRTFKPGRVRTPRFPAGILRSYSVQLRDWLREAKRLVDLILVPELSRIIDEAKRGRLTDTLDAYPETIARLMELVRASYGDTVSRAQIEAVALKTANSTSDFNKDEVGQVFRSIMGVDVIMVDGAVPAEVSAFVTDNVSKITTIQEQYFDQIEQLTLQEVRAGRRTSEISQTLQQRFQVSESRGNLIARDQVSKLNGNLTQIRQQEVGAESYKWHTAGDERVRASHRSKDGKFFDWSDPPSDTGHPGEDFQCRCWAEPIIEGLSEPKERTGPDPL